MWKQRSCNAWLKEGDSNTRYFHCNLVLGIEDETGAWVEDEAAMGGVVERYFENIFATSTLSVLRILSMEFIIGLSMVVRLI